MTWGVPGLSLILHQSPPLRNSPLQPREGLSHGVKHAHVTVTAFEKPPPTSSCVAFTSIQSKYQMCSLEPQTVHTTASTLECWEIVMADIGVRL